MLKSLTRVHHKVRMATGFHKGVLLFFLHFSFVYIPSFTSVQFSRARLFATPRTAACQAFLSITSFQSLFKLIFIESVSPFNHLILCPLLLLPSIFPSIRVFSNESVLLIRWPKYWSWSFSFSISPSNEYSGLISFRISTPYTGFSPQI